MHTQLPLPKAVAVVDFETSINLTSKGNWTVSDLLTAITTAIAPQFNQPVTLLRWALTLTEQGLDGLYGVITGAVILHPQDASTI